MRIQTKNIDPEQWIAWIMATAVAAFTLVVFIYSNFATKSEASGYQEELNKRLDRLEHKIDSLMLGR